MGPAEIQSYGVSTVTELLDELAPQTRSDRGRGGESPVVLLNGRRISGFNEIRDIPVEAILRVDILPEEVSSFGVVEVARAIPLGADGVSGWFSTALREGLTGQADANWPDWYAQFMVDEQA